MTVVRHHPDGVIVDGRTYYRDEFYAADHISVREWLALGVVILGLLVWAGLLVGGVAWVIWMVIGRGPR